MMKDSNSVARHWLHHLGLAALVLSLIVFFLYAFGVPGSDIEPGLVAESWEGDTDAYLESTGIEGLPLWMFSRMDGYFLITAALAILATTALPTLFALAVYWFRRRDWLYGTMALAISLVLITAIVS